MKGDKGTSAPHNQRLRALLFTDLCDSLQLVERIGDVAAAELFQQHDRLVLGLQQRWNGQLIDRSDGLFVLFERTIDGVGFALAYQTAVEALGRERGIVLRARAGLHVGDVLLWNNSAEAMAHGAKPVEVEGLAKPMAARLMQLAWPGQVLLSATAEHMARRATSTLPWASEALRWKHHGRWRFKGITERQDVFEIGLRGSAPLRRPRSGEKAWRDLPLWRRPAAVVTEAALAVTLGVLLWMLLRPAPAIAFAERDWVILAAVQNTTAYPQLDSSLEQALYISLGQSRFVNILSELKVRDTLQLMQRSPQARLDRGLAIEVALRDGARAVLVPSVLELNGKVRVSVEVVDPHSGQTVYTRYADGRGLESILTSTDHVVAALRADLGEALRDVGRDQRPLPTVATANLDALHAYAKGVDATAAARYDDALMFYEQATRLDPAFAFAYVGQMTIQHAKGNLEQAAVLYRKAVSQRAHLTARDQLYLDAWAADFAGAPPMRIADKWRLLTELYPDDPAGWMNYAKILYTQGDYDGALAATQPLLARQHSRRALVLVFVARVQLARGEVAAAEAALRGARLHPGWNGDGMEPVIAALAGDFEAANAGFAAMPVSGPGTRMLRAAVLAMQERAHEAATDMRQVAAQCTTVGGLCDIYALQALAWREQEGDHVTAQEYLRVLDRALAAVDRRHPAPARRNAFMALAAAYHAARAGHASVVLQRRDPLQALPERDADPRLRELWNLLRARMAFDQGDLDQAQDLLAQQPSANLFQWRVLQLDLVTARGDQAAVARQAAWLQRHAGLAFAEDTGDYALLPLNAMDVQRLAAGRAAAVMPDKGTVAAP